MTDEQREVFEAQGDDGKVYMIYEKIETNTVRSPHLTGVSSEQVQTRYFSLADGTEVLAEDENNFYFFIGPRQIKLRRL